MDSNTSVHVELPVTVDAKPDLLPVDHLNITGSSKNIRLPWELFTDLLERFATPVGGTQHLDPALLVFAQTCRVLQSEAERIIYRKVTIQTRTSKAAKINDVLQKRAAKYVECLYIVDSGPGVNARGGNAANAFSPFFAYKLPFARMTRIRTLDVFFIDDIPGHERETSRIFKKLNTDLPVDTLDEFRTFTSSPPRDLQFLRRQSLLRHLYAARLPDELVNDPSFLPRLDNLELPKGPEQAIKFLETRPLRGLYLSLHSSRIKSPLRGSLLRSLELNLNFTSHADRLSFLILRTEDCPNLRYLSLFLASKESSIFLSDDPDDDEDDDENIEWFSPLIKVLESWSKLEAFFLEFSTYSRSGPLALMFKESCRAPRLKSAVLSIQSMSLTDQDEVIELRRDGDAGWKVIKILEPSDWKDEWKSIVWDE
ncbi:hypothetical protein SISNIDRAFT_300937 [Sistotremastrum niveocremeum HHB9708]|uniref:F-box domain-containing protein n=1 Tax=Sistotremastrum niveocremeum HHB9708 TaxID=1314777 RepID=A0A164NAF8_9AGAM|nr:hypothetical protein SISNIDRAFT_300937 [Sistotremastrum niveocremeum HHB9708]